MKAPKRKPAPSPAQPSLPGTSAGTRAYSQENMAKLAVARKPTTPSGHRVQLALTLYLAPDVAEYWIARAIREGRNLAALVTEILAEERRRHA